MRVYRGVAAVELTFGVAGPISIRPAASTARPPQEVVQVLAVDSETPGCRVRLHSSTPSPRTPRRSMTVPYGEWHCAGW